MHTHKSREGIYKSKDQWQRDKIPEVHSESSEALSLNIEFDKHIHEKRPGSI
jgi:hypothetical protein